jgi:hypothetical protein
MLGRNAVHTGRLQRLEHLARPASSRAEFRHTARSSSAPAAANEESPCNCALLAWPSQAASHQSIGARLKGKMVDFDYTSDSENSVLETIDDVFALFISDWTVASAIKPTVQ